MTPALTAVAALQPNGQLAADLAMIQLNVTTPAELTGRLLLPGMLERHGGS
jgi:hypothetical protein